MCIHKSKKKAFPVEEHEHSSAGASVQFPNTELHRAFAFRASQIRGFACGKSVRGGISVTVMVIHAGSPRRFCREGMGIWFSVRVPFKFYWRTPPWSQERRKIVGHFQAIYHTMFNYVYHIELLSFGGLFLKKINLGLVSSRGSGYCIHLHLTDIFNWTFQSNVQASYSATETVKLSVKYQLSEPVISGLFLSFFIFYFIPLMLWYLLNQYSISEGWGEDLVDLVSCEQQSNMYQFHLE